MKKSTHTSEYTSLRSELRQAREAAGISQRELATRLNVPHSWVAKVETGERRIDLVEFGWFIAACGLDPIEASSRVLRSLSRPKGGRLK